MWFYLNNCLQIGDKCLILNVTKLQRPERSPEKFKLVYTKLISYPSRHLLALQIYLMTLWRGRTLRRGTIGLNYPLKYLMSYYYFYI